MDYLVCYLGNFMPGCLGYNIFNQKAEAAQAFVITYQPSAVASSCRVLQLLLAMFPRGHSRGSALF